MSIVGQVQILLNDSGVFWPNAQVIDAINEAQLWAMAQCKWKRTQWALSFSPGTDLFTLPTDVLIPGWIETTLPTNGGVDISHTRAFPTTHRELEHFLRTWRSAGLDAPRYFVIWDSTNLRLFPRPDIAYTYFLWGVQYPTEIVDTSASITGPPGYILAVQYMAAGLLLEATRPDLADMYYALADEQVMKLKRQLRNQQSHNIRRLRPSGVSIGSGPVSTLSPPGRFDLNQGGSIAQLPTYYPLET